MATDLPLRGDARPLQVCRYLQRCAVALCCLSNGTAPPAEATEHGHTGPAAMFPSRHHVEPGPGEHLHSTVTPPPYKPAPGSLHREPSSPRPPGVRVTCHVSCKATMPVVCCVVRDALHVALTPLATPTPLHLNIALPTHRSIQI